MIPTKARRSKGLRLSKNLERQYKETRCRDCTVVVTRMNFAKILGKFTKVKIQYETSATPKTKRTIESSPNSRLKSNENGMVVVHRNAYNLHPAKKLLGVGKKSKNNEHALPRQTSNVLKENNRLKKIEDTENHKKLNNSKLKQYGIVFVNPTSKKKEIKSKISLDSLLPTINKSILPSEDWCIDYFPKNGEPKDDKIYDRIAAELEDLMYNEKSKSDVKDNKVDEFPSILEILNDNSKGATEKTNEHSSSVNLESSDVEAMLLGKSKSTDSTAMDVDSTDVSSLITGLHKSSNIQPLNTERNDNAKSVDDNPESPSILDETSQELPVPVAGQKSSNHTSVNESSSNATAQSMQIDENDNTNTNNRNNNMKTEVTQVIFKKTINGTSSKTVICPKNLKYSISIQGKSVELLGAPKIISSLEDLQVLLQIVEESELTSLYVLH